MSEYQCSHCGNWAHCLELDDNLVCDNCREGYIDSLIEKKIEEEIK